MTRIIRVTRPSDLSQMVSIYNHAVVNTTATFELDPQGADEFLAFCPDWGSTLQRAVVCLEAGQIVGYAGTYPFSKRRAYSDLAELCCYVHPEKQACGIGGLLMKHLHSTDFLSGLHTVLALINTTNNGMIRLCQRVGYSYKGELSSVAVKFGERQSLAVYQYFFKEHDGANCV